MEQRSKSFFFQYFLTALDFKTMQFMEIFFGSKIDKKAAIPDSFSASFKSFIFRYSAFGKTFYTFRLKTLALNISKVQNFGFEMMKHCKREKKI